MSLNHWMSCQCRNRLARPPSARRTGLEEEQPDAYKDVNEVVHVLHEAGISRKVARLRPVGVIKG